MDTPPPNTIYFYRAKASEQGCFSNFSNHPVFLKGKKWPTTEHYFQAQKFAGTPYEEHVRATPSPGKAAQMGRRRDLPLRKDWEKVKEGIMKEALIAKFTQNEGLKEILLKTGDKTLVEHTTNDKYWADGGGPGLGKNRLGFLLMVVREEFRAAVNAPTNTTTTSTSSDTTETEEKGESSEAIEGKSTEEEGGGEEQEEEGIEGFEPNVNHMHDPGVIPEDKQPMAKGKRKTKKGGSKSRSQRGVFRDADGHSTLEKTNEKKGSVTVIGEGTVFSEKALPPQAKFVVNKHQMQRKYLPTEKDVVQQEEDDEPVEPTKAPKKNVMADFFKLRVNDEKVETTVQVAPEEAMTAEECIETAKNNLELLSTISEAELRTEILENLRKVRDAVRRFIEEFSETSDERLAAVMDCYTKLEEVLV